MNRWRTRLAGAALILALAGCCKDLHIHIAGKYEVVEAQTATQPEPVITTDPVSIDELGAEVLRDGGFE